MPTSPTPAGYLAPGVRTGSPLPLIVVVGLDLALRDSIGIIPRGALIVLGAAVASLDQYREVLGQRRMLARIALNFAWLTAVLFAILLVPSIRGWVAYATGVIFLVLMLFHTLRPARDTNDSGATTS